MASTRTIQVMAGVTILLVAVYFVLRAAAAGCSGTACDAYIPLSLLLPIVVVVMVAVTGAFATRRAPRGSLWFAILLAATLLGVLGPVIALALFRDQPDVFVPVATVLVLLLPAAALAYSVVRHSPPAA